MFIDAHFHCSRLCMFTGECNGKDVSQDPVC